MNGIAEVLGSTRFLRLTRPLGSHGIAVTETRRNLPRRTNDEAYNGTELLVGSADYFDDGVFWDG
jgi:hypothetical protein